MMYNTAVMNAGYIENKCNWDALGLAPNTKAFLKRVYASGLDKYERRLATLGFANGTRALDAGCGLGQWSLVLSNLCDEVQGVDVSSERIKACNSIANALGVNNMQFSEAHLEKLPFSDAYFDRVICYSVLYLTNYEQSIAEFARVTKSGGLVYISTNGIGRYLFDVVKRPNPAPDFDPRVYGVKTIINTLFGRRNGLSPQNGGVAMGRTRTEGLLRTNGFEIVDSGCEGRLLGGNEPFLPGRYLGLVSAFDILARKI